MLQRMYLHVKDSREIWEHAPSRKLSSDVSRRPRRVKRTPMKQVIIILVIWFPGIVSRIQRNAWLHWLSEPSIATWKNKRSARLVTKSDARPGTRGAVYWSSFFVIFYRLETSVRIRSPFPKAGGEAQAQSLGSGPGLTLSLTAALEYFLMGCREMWVCHALNQRHPDSTRTLANYEPSE